MGSQKMYPTDRQTTENRAFPLKRMQQHQHQTWSRVGYGIYVMSSYWFASAYDQQQLFHNRFWYSTGDLWYNAHIPYVSQRCSGSWLVMMLPLCLSDYRQPRPCKQEAIFRWLIRIHLRRCLHWKQYVQLTKLSHQEKKKGVGGDQMINYL